MKFCPVCGTEYADDVKFCPRDGQTLKSANPSGDLIGQVIADRYHVLKKLGEGGMGAVYLAEHVKMGRKSAIKVMTSAMSNDPDAVSRFNREANNASRINHPNVCAIYDFGETGDGLIYLAMEFIEGKSLSGLLKETGPLPLPRATTILRQTADALDVAHGLGIVHRDLKPDNIMITSQAGKDVVKVVDFGIAKAVGGEETGQKVTKTGLVVGTPEYMSPEQLSGDKLDGRSDLYSLALVYYRMITGALPFQAETSQETMIKRLTDDPMPLDQALPSGRFPAALQPVMDRALARYPNDRYGTAGEFATDTERAVASGGGAEQGATMVVGADQMKTMVAGAAASAVPKTRVAGAADRPTPAGAPAPKSRTPMILGAAAVVVIGVGVALKGTLFPAKVPPPAATQHADSSARPGSVNPTATQPPAGTTQEMSRAANSQVVPPPTGKEPARPVTHRPDIGTLMKQAVALQDSAFSDDAVTRVNAEVKGAAIYGQKELPDSVRAAAALAVGLAYQADSKFDLSRTWLTKAAALDPANQHFLTALNAAHPPQ